MTFEERLEAEEECAENYNRSRDHNPIGAYFWLEAARFWRGVAMGDV